ncbi:hypothetical protein TrRE_jg9749 [Triparma retinervis]|uniref:Uncharacterized protein n=1 Tax=Triparma retinervis TaxID=2557542 RepID=A0A9W7DPK6_9STRA|nr:hypothetical protein TrRE_jg9749 [Triparma retinervis]
MLMEQGVPDLITISPDQKPFANWGRPRGGSVSSDCSVGCSKLDELEDLSGLHLEDVDELEIAPVPVKSCLRTEVSAKESNPRRRTWFDLRPPNVRVVAGDSGWWSPDDLKNFRDRLLQDECLMDNYRRKRVNSVDANFEYDNE